MLPSDIELPTVPRSWIVGAVALVLVGAGLWGWSCARSHAQTVRIEKADIHQSDEMKAVTEGEAHEQEAANRVPILASDDAEVERLEKLQPAPDPGPAAPSVPGPEPVGPPPMVVPDAEHQLIAALKKDLDDTRAQLHTVTLEAEDYKRANAASQAEVIELRAGLSVRPTWAAGALVGTCSTLGAWVERDLGVVRVGVDVVRRQLSGGQTTVEAVGRIGVSF